MPVLNYFHVFVNVVVFFRRSNMLHHCQIRNEFTRPWLQCQQQKLSETLFIMQHSAQAQTVGQKLVLRRACADKLFIAFATKTKRMRRMGQACSVHGNFNISLRVNFLQVLS